MSEPKIKLVWRKIDELIPYEHNAKLHPQEQIDKLVGSFDEFGRIVPAGIDRDGHLIYGHGRILAARQRGDTDFPCIEIDGLSDTQRRAFVHADNLLAESGTDEEILRAEMQALQAAALTWPSPASTLPGWCSATMRTHRRRRSARTTSTSTLQKNRAQNAARYGSSATTV